MTTAYDLAILGAGPHGLAVAVHAVHAGIDPESIAVIDPSGTWLDRWQTQFRGQGIDDLRSPGVHHPGVQPAGLTAWAQTRGYRSTGRYGQPANAAFGAYCRTLIADHGLDGRVQARRAELLCGDGPATVLLDDGSLVTATRAVVATNPCRPRVPVWAHRLCRAAPGRVRHANHVDLNTEDIDGRRVAIVGGGQSAAHLAVGAAERGATVDLVLRRTLRTSSFDVDPGWLGPRHLDGFARLDPGARAIAARDARDGGSVSPMMADRLRRLQRSGTVVVHEDCGIIDAGTSGGNTALQVRRRDQDAGEGALVANLVWLATGTEPTIDRCTLLEDLRRSHPCPLHGGLPDLDDDLSWPGTPVHLCGRAATLCLGPAAGNLWGARMAAQRIAARL